MPAPEVRHEFHVEADPCFDILLRVIGPFAVQGAVLGGCRRRTQVED